MSARTGRPMSPADIKTAELIRGLNADRTALRSVLLQIVSLGEHPVITHDDGSKWVDFDWLVAKLKEALP